MNNSNEPMNNSNEVKIEDTPGYKIAISFVNYANKVMESITIKR